jgi:hypothetical protein
LRFPFTAATDGEDALLEALGRLLCSSQPPSFVSQPQTEQIAAVSRDDSGVSGFEGPLNVSIMSMRPLFRLFTWKHWKSGCSTSWYGSESFELRVKHR